jgi:hypothetical protein
VLDKTSFVNVDPERRLIEPIARERTLQNVPIVPVRLYGMPAGMDPSARSPAQYALRIPLEQGSRLVASDSNHHWLELCLLAAERF